MSYGRDPDRFTRGVGAIAASDQVASRKRHVVRRRRWALGDDSKQSSGLCYTYDSGAYYLGTRKVSEAEAKLYAACPTQPQQTSSGAQRSKGKLTGYATMAQLGPIPEQPTVPIGTTPRPPRPAQPGTNVTPVGPLEPLRPGTPGTPGSPGSGTPTPPTTPPSSSGADRLRPRPRPPGTSVTPSAVKPPSVTSTWIPPAQPTPLFTAPTSSTVEQSVLVTQPAPEPPAKRPNLLLWGAGIGLLYLLTRD